MSRHGVPMSVMDAMAESWGRLASDDAAQVAVLRSESSWTALLVTRDRAGQSAVLVRRHTPCDEVAG